MIIICVCCKNLCPPSSSAGRPPHRDLQESQGLPVLPAHVACVAATVLQDSMVVMGSMGLLEEMEHQEHLVYP